MNKSVKRALLASAILSAAAVAPAFAQTTPTNDVTVVLVHGAFADGSSWGRVIPLLQAKGVKVIAVQNPLSSLADDVTAAQRVIDAQTGKVVLVGHSWGGAVITQAGVSDKIKALVYVAAFAPSEGEALGTVGKDYPLPPGIPTLKPDAGGYVTLSDESYATNFAQDLPATTAKAMAATQGLFPAKAFGEPITFAAWKNKPNYYIVASNDRMIDPGLERDFAKKMHAITTVLPTSHVPMLSRPKQVADVIMAAVNR
ncbi:putative signal peptide protein [Collimonas arenae]|uniref:Putative signal peptide protein n=1 Tax=Collimonas arenae TaxID=279058 RepID=A0A0A1F4K2_9BURK|nr:alpha/beta hydrolase [Collimonas arenae]AIY39476.1 putative signal peptide protein [Collimonas arenae]